MVRSGKSFPGTLISPCIGGLTLTSVFEQVEEEISSHALVSVADNARVRVIAATKEWPVREVKKVLKEG